MYMKYSAFIAIALVVFSFMSLVTETFGVQDDFMFYQQTHLADIWKTSYQNAVDQGRFFQMIIVPLFFKLIPYGLNSLRFASYLNLFLWSIDVVLIALLLKKILQQEAVFCIVLLFFAATVNIVGHYSPMVSYPVHYSFSIGLFLLSLLSFISYQENRKSAFLLVSIVLYSAFILFCELNILYLPFYLLLMKDMDKSWWRGILPPSIRPFIAVTIVYVLVYVVWSSFMSNNLYRGTKISSHLEISAVFKSIWAYSKPAIPLHFFHTDRGYLINNSFLPEGHKQNIAYIIYHAKALWWIKAFIIAGIAYAVTIRYKVSFTSKFKYVIPLLILYFFVPNSLISITPKYIEWSAFENYYVYTFYSYLTIVPFIAILFLFLLEVVPKASIKRAVVLILSLTLFVVSIVNDYLNEHALRSIRKSEQIIEALHQWYATDSFKQIKDGQKIEASCMTHRFSDILYFGFIPKNLEQYTKIHTNKSIDFIHKDSILNFKESEMDRLRIDTVQQKPRIYHTLAKE